VNGRAVVLRVISAAAAISCDWCVVPANRAFGVELDMTAAMGREHYLAQLARQAKRVRLIKGNVLSVRTERVDVIAALNFSFCVFKERATLMRYLTRCRAAIKPGGIMVMDIYGGPDSQKPGREKTRFKGFTYVWDQAAYNPITNEALNHIHFVPRRHADEQGVHL
jgi:cell division protein ZapA (FtsZ GTPase activity inhibitor)